MLRWFHSRLRGWLWYIVGLFAASLVLGWILGTWSAGWNVVIWVVLTVSALLFISLLWAGWAEWRRGRNG